MGGVQLYFYLGQGVDTRRRGRSHSIHASVVLFGFLPQNLVEEARVQQEAVLDGRLWRLQEKGALPVEFVVKSIGERLFLLLTLIYFEQHTLWATFLFCRVGPRLYLACFHLE